MSDQRRATIIVSIVGALAVIAYAVWGALQVLVLAPLAAAPGLSLREVRGAMDAVGESPSDLPVFAFLAFGVVFAVVVAVLAIRAHLPAEVAALLFLAMIMLGGPALFIASFGAGMALADTFAVAGGISAPGAFAVYAVSGLAGVGCLVVWAFLAMWRRPAPATI